MTNIVNVGYGSANYYVLEGVPARLLVDVGWPGTVPKLQAALRRTGVPLNSIAYLLATHYHPDHAGAAQELKQLGVQLIVLENQPAGIAFLNQWMKAKPQYHYLDITSDDNVNLRSADSRAFLQRLGLQGEILLTPGHSDDSITLALDSGVAFTGDLPPLGMFADSQHPAAASWERIRGHHVHAVYPAHGGAYELEM
jgi:ribonuclease/clavin/mitogillin